MANMKNLVRAALMGALHHPLDAVALLDDDPWLRLHVAGDDRMLVDVLGAMGARDGFAALPVLRDEKAHAAMLELALWLDRAGLDVWAKNNDGLDAFDLAVRLGCSGLVAWMGKHPRKPGDLALRWLGREDLPMSYTPQTSRALALIGFDPNQANARGDTALHEARSAEMVQVLLEAAADPSLANDQGRDARSHWDVSLSASSSAQKAMVAMLARFEKPDPQREIEGFAKLVQRRGITQAMHRLGIGGVDIGSARLGGFSLPETVVMLALNQGLSGAPIIGSASVKDISNWAKRCLSVLGHYQKAGGGVDAGIISAFSILQRAIEHAKTCPQGIHQELYKDYNKSYLKQLQKSMALIDEIVPASRRHLLSEDCSYLDRAVEAGLLEVGSLVADCLAMESTGTNPHGMVATGLVERGLRWHWDGRWNHHPFQFRGALADRQPRYHLIDRLKQVLGNGVNAASPRTGAMIVAVLADHARNRALAQQAGPEMARLAGQMCVADGVIDPGDEAFIQGCLGIVQGADREQGQACLGKETMDQVIAVAGQLRASMSQRALQGATPGARSKPGGLGRI